MLFELEIYKDDILKEVDIVFDDEMQMGRFKISLNCVIKEDIVSKVCKMFSHF